MEDIVEPVWMGLDVADKPDVAVRTEVAMNDPCSGCGLPIRDYSQISLTGEGHKTNQPVHARMPMVCGACGEAMRYWPDEGFKQLTEGDLDDLDIGVEKRREIVAIQQSVRSGISERNMQMEEVLDALAEDLLARGRQSFEPAVDEAVKTGTGNFRIFFEEASEITPEMFEYLVDGGKHV